MKRKLTIYFALMITFSCLSFSETAFVKKVPNGAKFDCLTCHTTMKGGKSWNAFGTTIKNSYLNGTTINWGPALAKLDSDGDGRTNGEELGDPSGSWKVGNANPGVLANITNPGDKSSVTSVEELLLSSEFIKINGFYPNPANQNTTLNFSLKEAANTNISLFSVNGELISSLVDTYFASGDHSYKIFGNTNKLTNGTYYIRIVSGRFFTLQKVVINN